MYSKTVKIVFQNEIIYINVFCCPDTPENDIIQRAKEILLAGQYSIN